MDKPPVVVAGEFYFSVICHVCKAPIPMAHDPSRGTVSVMVTGPGKLKTTCQSCGTAAEYRPEEVQSMKLGFAD